MSGLDGYLFIVYRQFTIMKNLSIRLEPKSTPPDEQPDADELAAVCKALAHPVRIKIIRHLLMEDRCICGGIVKILPLAQSTVSQHLKILKQAGLVRGNVEGPSICYCVDKKKLASVGEAIESLLILKDEDENEC